MRGTRWADAGRRAVSKPMPAALARRRVAPSAAQRAPRAARSWINHLGAQPHRKSPVVVVDLVAAEGHAGSNRLRHGFLLGRGRSMLSMTRKRRRYSAPRRRPGLARRARPQLVVSGP